MTLWGTAEPHFVYFVMFQIEVAASVNSTRLMQCGMCGTQWWKFQYSFVPGSARKGVCCRA